ncbi:DUF5995 family protein [Kitasatospora sp. NPDC056327]|uniref:DUF5995 family protein n=1 Tax=Kitasatospora sp. NPDC056327 TaxID=3345785 RepID=UPI0035DC94C0
MTRSVARAARSTGDAVARMRGIGAGLDPRDGVACFNRAYLAVMELIGQGFAAGRFADRAFAERLAVVLANLYFDAVDAAAAGRPVNPAWQPLFEARGSRKVWPVQFVFAGMYAHVNHDLAPAVVATCIECRTTPDTPPVHADYLAVGELFVRVEAQARAEFGARIGRVAPGPAEPLEHIVSGFSVARAGEAAWAAVQTLWHQRNIRPMYEATLAAVTASTALAGRMLVTPVLAPVEERDGEG